jgi:hypothetical protein
VVVTEHEDPDKLADHLEHETDRLERHSAELGDEISDAREDWRRKRSDEGVPGAPPPAPEEDPHEDPDGNEEAED